MSQALYTSMSGINAGTREIQVVSNNVANINTVGFKASSINFADVYYTTVSYGSVAVGNSGGTNPIQIGVGVKTSAITKDFASGSVVSTGKSTDLMIQGTGFFAVRSADNQVYYTRAGDFSWDNKGNLVTAPGYKVMGTDNIYSAKTSDYTVYVPTSLIPVVGGNEEIESKKVEELNGIDTAITQGKFTVTLQPQPGQTAKEITVTLAETDLNQDVATLKAALSSALGSDITVSCITDPTSELCGTIQFAINDTSTYRSLTFGKLGDTSNFCTATGMSSAGISGNKYNSNVLDYSCKITDVTSTASATGINSISINNDGSVQATYQNGDTLSVQVDEGEGATYQFVYTTQNGIAIKGDSLEVSSNVAVPANFVIQLATVTNQDGLLAVGSNLFKAGPNTGAITYTVGNQMGAGAIASGSLEASNVDLSEELANMILAQRAVQANSRVFTTTSNVLETITNMGR